MAELNEQQEDLGDADDIDLQEVGNAFEPQAKQFADSFQLLKSRLTLLKANEEHTTMKKNKTRTEILPYDQIRQGLNDAIILAKLQELAWETAKENVILKKYVRTNSSSRSIEGTDTKREHVKTEMMKVLSQHHAKVMRLDARVKERSEKLTRGAQKSRELNHELQKFEQMLSIQKQELNAGALEDTAQKRIEKLFKKLEKLNVSRMLIVNLLGVSDVNFMEYPQWANLIVKCRKQITMETLETYELLRT